HVGNAIRDLESGKSVNLRTLLAIERGLGVEPGALWKDEDMSNQTEYKHPGEAAGVIKRMVTDMTGILLDLDPENPSYKLLVEARTKLKRGIRCCAGGPASKRNSDLHVKPLGVQA